MKKWGIVAAFLLAGCASFTSTPTGVTAQDKTILQKDLAAAAHSAQAYGDQVGFDCWNALQIAVANKLASEKPQIAGVASAVEAVRIGVVELDRGVPEDVHVKCAPVLIDARILALRLAAMGIHF